MFFTPDEIVQVLGKEAGALFCAYFEITDAGNFEGKSIPVRMHAADIDPVDAQIKRMVDKIYAYRRARFPLHKDDKVLLPWNGLMIGALARLPLCWDEAGLSRRRGESRPVY